MVGGRRSLQRAAAALGLLVAAQAGGCSSEPALGVGSADGAGGGCADYVTTDGFHCCCGKATCSLVPCAKTPDGLGGASQGGSNAEGGASGDGGDGVGGVRGSGGTRTTGGRASAGGTNASGTGGESTSTGGRYLPPGCESGRCDVDACPTVFLTGPIPSGCGPPWCPPPSRANLAGCCQASGRCGARVTETDPVALPAGCQDRPAIESLSSAWRLQDSSDPWLPCGPARPDAGVVDGGARDAAGDAIAEASGQ